MSIKTFIKKTKQQPQQNKMKYKSTTLTEITKKYSNLSGVVGGGGDGDGETEDLLPNHNR